MSAKASVARVALAIKKRRTELGTSQESLAFDTGISLRHVQRIEAGTIDLRLSTLDRLAKALETTAARLLTDAEEAARRRK